MAEETSMTELTVVLDSGQPPLGAVSEDTHCTLNDEIDPHDDHKQFMDEGLVVGLKRRAAASISDINSAKFLQIVILQPQDTVKEIVRLGVYATDEHCSTPEKLQGEKMIAESLQTVSAVLIQISFGAIGLQGFYTVPKGYSWIQAAQAIIQWPAILLMILGIYLKPKHPTVSKWLQRCGNLLCLEGLLLMLAPALKIPPACTPVPMLVLAAIFVTAFKWS